MNVRRTLGPLLCLVGIALLWGCGDGDVDSSPQLELSPNPALTIGAPQGRPAKVVLPGDYDIRKRYPLVILLHGFGANATLQDFIFHLAQRTTPYQFILVLPDGTPNSRGELFWDATPECCNFEGPPVDDVGYLASLMNEASQTYAVDRARIRLVGHSNGGYMSYRYICEHPVAVDRIAVLAGSTFIDPAACRDPQPVDIVHMHGTKDDEVPYEPNLPPSGDPNKLETIGAQAAVERWAGIAGCADDFALVERRDYHRRIGIDGDPAETEIYRSRDCRSGHSVELWRSVGADHLYLSVNDRWRDDVAAFLSE